MPIKLLNDDDLYQGAIDMIDSNMTQLRKKQFRDILLFKLDQQLTDVN